VAVDDEAKELARRHYEVEEGLTDIFVLRDAVEASVGRANGEKIKLLEVNQDTIPSGIMPIEFGPSPASGIHYSSVIVEITPEEYERLQNEELSLPDGWQIGERVPRPDSAGD
jgi:hypothetical protein